MSPFLVGYFNLMKSVLGSGLVTYPYLFTINGVVPTVILTLISAFFSAQGLLIYLKLNHMKNKTMSTLTDCKRIKLFVNTIIVMKCVSVTLSYVVMIREIFHNICDRVNVHCPNVLFIAFVLVTMPISTFKQFSKLRFTSFLGIVATCIMVLATLWRLYSKQPQGSIALYKKIDYNTLGSYVYTFTCHQNIFSFQNECFMSLNQCYSVILCTVASCILLYFVFGLSNAYLFSIGPKFFDSLYDDKITLVMQACFLVMVTFSIPLQLNAAQLYLNITASRYRMAFVSTVVIISIAIALLEISFNTILSLIGGTVSSLMCFIISGFYYILIGDRKNKLWFFNAVFTLIFGVLILAATAYTMFALVMRKL